MNHDDIAPPWWLEAGPESCEFCQRTFHYEAGYHCIHCDRPICPVCVVESHETRSTTCPECHEAQVNDDSREGGE